jgi:hypothetical protein
MHRIEPDLIREKLGPEEDRSLVRYLNTIQIGPDDEAFYRETKAGYMIAGYRDEMAEVRSELAVAEKNGDEKEQERLAARLIELDRIINNTIETLEGNNAG